MSALDTNTKIKLSKIMPKYDGESEDFSSFIRKFNQKAAAYGIENESEACTKLLPCCLEGRALEKYNELPKLKILQTRSWRQLIDLLAEKMAKPNQAFLCQEILYARKQQASESIEDYANAIKDLVNKAYTDRLGYNNVIRTREQVRFFIRGLKLSLKECIIREKCDTLDEAIAKTLTEEELQKQLAREKEVATLAINFTELSEQYQNNNGSGEESWEQTNDNDDLEFQPYDIPIDDGECEHQNEWFRDLDNNNGQNEENFEDNFDPEDNLTASNYFVPAHMRPRNYSQSPTYYLTIIAVIVLFLTNGVASESFGNGSLLLPLSYTRNNGLTLSETSMMLVSLKTNINQNKMLTIINTLLILTIAFSNYFCKHLQNISKNLTEKTDNNKLTIRQKRNEKSSNIPKSVDKGTQCDTTSCDVPKVKINNTTINTLRQKTRIPNETLENYADSIRQIVNQVFSEENGYNSKLKEKEMIRYFIRGVDKRIKEDLRGKWYKTMRNVLRKAKRLEVGYERP